MSLFKARYFLENGKADDWSGMGKCFRHDTCWKMEREIMPNVFSHLLAKIAPEQLLQIHFRSHPSDFSVSIVLFYTDEILVVSLVDQMSNSDGVSMILQDKIAYLKTDSLYLQSFQKKPHTKDSLKQNQQVR